MIGTGDLVGCIRTPGKGRGPRPFPHPVRGRYYRVLASKPHPNGRWIMLCLSDCNPTAGWNAACFRKVEKGLPLSELLRTMEPELEDA